MTGRKNWQDEPGLIPTVAASSVSTDPTTRAGIVEALRKLAYHGDIRRDQLFDLGRLAQRWISHCESPADVNNTVAMVEMAEKMAG